MNCVPLDVERLKNKRRRCSFLNLKKTWNIFLIAQIFAKHNSICKLHFSLLLFNAFSNKNAMLKLLIVIYGSLISSALIISLSLSVFFFCFKTIKLINFTGTICLSQKNFVWLFFQVQQGINFCSNDSKIIMRRLKSSINFQFFPFLNF